MDLQKGRLRQGGLNMSKMGRKITALMLALLMATSTCSVGLAAQEQVGSIGTAVSASAGDTVTVTFDSQGGAELAPIETTAGSTVLLPENPSKPGYAFKGWYTEPNGEGSLFYIDTPVTESITVYAYWEEIPTGLIDEQPSDNFYEIFVRAFCDSDGDGIGDFNGLASKMDYLQDLGITGIWLMPITESGSYHGYDTVDYYSVEQDYGTMEDFENMLDEAHAHGIKVIMDLVVNHCSDQHEWFKKACEDPDGEYGKYFYIEDCPNGKLPCNWRSYFGGSVWEPLPGQPGKYYLHMFHKKQPDLNWENPKLREEIYKMINWWLDKGLAGFRIDAIINIKKPLPWQNYPADRKDGMCSPDEMLKHAVGVGEFLGEMRDRTFLPHGAFTVGEIFNEKAEELPDFIGDNGYFSTMFDFNETIFGASAKGWYDQTVITPNDYRSCCFASQKKIEDFGMLSNIIENHDEPRGVSRYIPEGECTNTSKKLLATMNIMLRGLPFIYQGQEIGMENVEFQSIDEVDDISTLDEYQVALNAGLTPDSALKAVNRISRDNARTPYQWDASANAGFTTGTPWLRVNYNYKKINLESQKNDPDSVYQYYRRLLALRKDPAYAETIVYGDLLPVFENQDRVMAYYRKSADQTLLVIGNYKTQQQTLTLPSKLKHIVLNNLPQLKTEGNEIMLEGYQAVILEMLS